MGENTKETLTRRRPENPSEQRYTIAVSALHWFLLFSPATSAWGWSLRREVRLSERLRLILMGAFTSVRIPFRSDKGRDGARSAMAAARWSGEARPFQSQRGDSAGWRDSETPLAAK